jgi:hypothetical protein
LSPFPILASLALADVSLTHLCHLFHMTWVTNYIWYIIYGSIFFTKGRVRKNSLLKLNFDFAIFHHHGIKLMIMNAVLCIIIMIWGLDKLSSLIWLKTHMDSIIMNRWSIEKISFFSDRQCFSEGMDLLDINSIDLGRKIYCGYEVYFSLDDSPLLGTLKRLIHFP